MKNSVLNAIKGNVYESDLDLEVSEGFFTPDKRRWSEY